MENETNEFGKSAILLVASEEYPVDGDMVVAKLRNGKLITKYYLRKDNIIHLSSKNNDKDDVIWRYQEDPGLLQWVYPIVEVNIKFRSED
jgi:phage repressor protein C with HTH and peptisase S24 domain